jgi:hypothetical protein
VSQRIAIEDRPPRRSRNDQPWVDGAKNFASACSLVGAGWIILGLMLRFVRWLGPLPLALLAAGWVSSKRER